MYAPEKYIFRIGFISSAPLLILSAYLVRDYIALRASFLNERGQKVRFAQSSSSCSTDSAQELACRFCSFAIEDACVVLVWGASLCLAVLAAVSEAEGGKVLHRPPSCCPAMIVVRFA